MKQLLLGGLYHMCTAVDLMHSCLPQGMVEQFRPGAPYVQAGQHCQPMDSNKVVMGTPLQMGVLTWTRTR